MKRELSLATFVISLVASPLLAQVPRSVATVFVDEAGNGSHLTRGWSDVNGNSIPDCDLLNLSASQECGAATAPTPLPSTLGVDPGPGGLNDALIYSLPASLAPGTQGDVFLFEGSSATDVVRFNGDRTVIFYAGLLPFSGYGTLTNVTKVSPQTVYIPRRGQPGFGFSGLTFMVNYLTYVFHSPTPAQRVLTLLSAAHSVDLQQSEQLLEAALEHLDAGHVIPSCNQLGAFVHQVQAQSGKSLAVAGANQLIATAARAMTAIGCN